MDWSSLIICNECYRCQYVICHVEWHVCYTGSPCTLTVRAFTSLSTASAAETSSGLTALVQMMSGHDNVRRASGCSLGLYSCKTKRGFPVLMLDYNIIVKAHKTNMASSSYFLDGSYYEIEQCFSENGKNNVWD